MTTLDFLLEALRKSIEEKRQTKNYQLPAKIESLILTSFPKQKATKEIEAVKKGVDSSTSPTETTAARFKTWVPDNNVKKNTNLIIKTGKVAVIEEVEEDTPEQRIEDVEVATQMKLNKYQEMSLLTDDEVITKFKDLKGLKKYMQGVFGFKTVNFQKTKTLKVFRQELAKKIIELGGAKEEETNDPIINQE